MNARERALYHAKATVAALEAAEQSAPRSARDIMQKHGIKERRIDLRINSRELGRSGFDAVNVARREAAHKLADDLIADQDFKLANRGSVPPDFGLPAQYAMLSYTASLVAISAEKLTTMLEEAFRAGRGA